MRNNKGFTLIELLAIIIIIAIISLITVPIVGNLIKTSKKKAFEASVQSLIQSAKTYYAKNSSKSFNTKEFVIENGKISSDLEVKGKLPRYAYIEITGSDKEDNTIPNGDIYIQATDGTFCGKKEHKNNLQITEDLSNCDKINTGSDEISLRTSYSKDIEQKTVDLYAQCTYSKGIKEVKFSTDGNTWYKSNVYANDQYYYQFTALTQNKNYDMQVKCISKDGKEENKTIPIILSYIPNPDFEEGNPGWARYKEIIVKYPKEAHDLTLTHTYMVGTSGGFKQISTKSCSGTECSDESTTSNKYKIESYTGDKCNSSTQVCYKFTFYDEYFNGIPIIAKTDPGEDSQGNQIHIAVGTHTIAKIDRTSPTWNSMANPYRNMWINTSYSITLKSNDNTGGSGIYYYMYTYADASTIDKANALGISQVGQNGYGSSDSLTKWVRYASTYDVSNTPTPQLSHTFTTTPFSAERNSDVYFRVCDHAGNCSNIARDTIKIDTTAPTCGSWTGESTTWKKGSRQIDIACTDPTNSNVVTSSPSGCEMNKYSFEVFDKDSEQQTYNANIEISDNAGNTKTCSKTVNVYIDNKSPTVSVSLYKYRSTDYDHPESPKSNMTSYTNNTWVGKTSSYNWNVLAYATATDSGSGISSNNQYHYKMVSKTSDKEVETDKRYRNFTTSRISEIQFSACDNVGNCSNLTSPKTIKVDHLNPDISYTRKPSSITDNCKQVTVKNVDAIDKMSGIDSFQYSRSDNSNGYKNIRSVFDNCSVSSSTTNLTSGTYSRNIGITNCKYTWTGYGLDFTLTLRAVDKAGNTSTKTVAIKRNSKTACTSTPDEEANDNDNTSSVSNNNNTYSETQPSDTCPYSSVPSAPSTQLSIKGSGNVFSGKTSYNVYSGSEVYLYAIASNATEYAYQVSYGSSQITPTKFITNNSGNPINTTAEKNNWWNYFLLR